MTRTFHPFEAPRLKLLRAGQHLEELKCRIEAFSRGRPFNFYTYTHPDRSPTILFGMIEAIPPDISLIYGDAIHCLRASLDLLASEVVRLAGKSTKDVYFPIADVEASLAARVKATNFDRGGPVAVRFLTDEIKPYRGGHATLRALHELDIQDKHQLIIPAYPTIRVNEMKVFHANGALELSNVGLGADVRIGISSVPSAVEISGELTLELDFTRLAPPEFRSKELLKTLEGLSVEVHRIVVAFEHLLTGSVREEPALTPLVENAPLNNRPRVMVVDHRFSGAWNLNDYWIMLEERGLAAAARVPGEQPR